MTVKSRLQKHSSVNVATGCIEWNGYKNKKGYGRIRFDADKKLEYAHRAAWIVENGDIPKGMHVLHRCDNPCCIRVDHLFLGTNQDNVDDKMNKGRHGCGADGENHYRTHLTNDDVIDIRIMASARIPQRAIAMLYGVTKGAIGPIVRGTTWKTI